MSTPLRKYDEPQNELESNSAAFAYNKNCNVMIVPDIMYSDEGVVSNDGASGEMNLENLGLSELMKSCVDNKEEFENESKAVGKSRITNTNLNFIITQ